MLNASWGYGAELCNWWVQTGATGLVRESFGWRAARGADTRSQTTARPPSNIVHSVSRYNTTVMSSLIMCYAVVDER